MDAATVSRLNLETLRQQLLAGFRAADSSGMVIDVRRTVRELSSTFEGIECLHLGEACGYSCIKAQGTPLFVTVSDAHYGQHRERTQAALISDVRNLEHENA